MNKLPYEIIEKIMDRLSHEDLVNFSKINKKYRDMCNQFPYKLKMLNIDYEDKNSFIYKYNKVNIANFKINGYWDYEKIYELYMKNIDVKSIKCTHLEITSMPILPNMIHFSGSDNQLTSFPVQPRMEYFSGPGNRFTSFPVQPKITLKYI